MTRTTAHVRRLAVIARAALAQLVVALVLLAPARVARADSRTEFLIGRLQADDFRVRTNAALALGQTGDDAVVVPLCNTLGDANAVVRQAVAVAFQRLAKPSSAGCLKDRLGVETSDAVKREISKALDGLSSGTPSNSASAPPRVVANAKYYVALSAISNQTGRPDDEIARVVGTALRGKLDELGGFQLAPDQESPDQARTAIAKRKLKGYYLAIRVEKFDYSDGNLRVRVKVAVFTYPGKDLRGEVPAGLTQTGVRPGDTSAEDNLLQMAAARAVDLFAQNFP
jgi:HEAT repeat protein